MNKSIRQRLKNAPPEIIAEMKIVSERCGPFADRALKAIIKEMDAVNAISTTHAQRFTAMILYGVAVGLAIRAAPELENDRDAEVMITGMTLHIRDGFIDGLAPVEEGDKG